MAANFGPSQPRGGGLRALAPLDMSTLSNNLPAPPLLASSPSTSPSYSSASRPRPSFSSTNGVPPAAFAHSHSGPISPTAAGAQSAFSPYSPAPPALPHKSPFPPHARPAAAAAVAQQHDSWDSQGPGGEQVFDGRAATSAAAAMEQRPLPTPPPVTSPTSATSASKRPNPLEDLIYTETLYVEDLGVIIKRVAGAWSRSNFPPPALDSMFRAVEAVYRINKQLLAKLNEIGPNPSSPKALGDLLMRWITDLSPAYTRYSTTFQVDFDRYDPVQSNAKLGPILSALNHPSTLPPSVDSAPPSLDLLFSLPVVRLGYYKKLYTKLLRSTQEGRSDHALLTDANNQLDHLIARCEEAKARSVVLENGGTLPLKTSPSLRQQPRVLEERAPEPAAAPGPQVGVALGGPRSEERSSDESGRAASSSSSYRSSAATGTTNNTSAATHLASSYNAPPRIEDLERRLSTERVLDIFTMLPKKCKLQMAPPHLPFVRQIRRSADVSISFTPLSDPSHREIQIPNGYIFLLTDLFLVCQRMTPEERHHSEGEADMWLLYPPLAGKHLKVVDGVREGELEVTIMRKEKLMVRTEDALAAREWRTAFEDAVTFGAQQGLAGRSDSTSSRSPMSPTSPPPSALSFPGRDALSPSFDPPHSATSAAFSSTSNGSAIHSPFSNSPQPSPEPLSPRVDSPQNMDPRAAPNVVGYGAPPAPSQGQYGGGDRERRAFSAGPAAPPPRGASMYKGPGYQSNQSLASGSSAPSPLPYSPAYPPQDYGRNSPAPGQLFNPSGQSSMNGRYSPHGQPNGYGPPSANSDFAPLPPPPQQGPYGTYPATRQQQPNQYDYPPPTMSGARPQRTNSGRSNGSYTSGRTDRSSNYPEPPPLPGKMGGPVDRFGSSTPGSNESYGNGPGRTTGASSRTGSGLLSPGGSIYRSQSAEGLRDNMHYRMPSAMLQEERSNSAPGQARGGKFGGMDDDESPPPSPLDKRPEQTTIVAQMRAKIFLRQNLGQWKSLGTGKLKLFLSTPSHIKQLVVDSDKGNPPKTVISTIVLTDGVERVGKTGVAIELSDSGSRTGIVYMLQMKTEQAATGLFDQLLLGSDRKRLTR